MLLEPVPHLLDRELSHITSQLMQLVTSRYYLRKMAALGGHKSLGWNGGLVAFERLLDRCDIERRSDSTICATYSPVRTAIGRRRFEEGDVLQNPSSL